MGKIKETQIGVLRIVQTSLNLLPRQKFEKMMDMTTKPTILFDMDGVLIDSELHWDRLLPDFLRTMIPDFSDQDMHTVQGLSNLSLYQWLCQKYGNFLSGSEFLPKLADFADEIYRGPVALMPGVLDLIQWLHQKQLVMAIVSSSPIRHIKIVRDRFGLTNYFPKIFSAEMVGGIGKPDPAVYRYAATTLGVLPNSCIAIEDSKNGVASAKDAGMTAIGLRSEQNRTQDLYRADYVVEGFDSAIRQILVP